jgi:hypothetical protein
MGLMWVLGVVALWVFLSFYVGYWGFFVLWGVFCILGFSVLWGVTFVPWVIDGVYYCILGLMWVLGVVGL